MATVATRIGLADHGRAMTLEEFEEAEEEEGYRYELARGVLQVTQVPDDPHGFIVWNLMRVIIVYDREHPGMILRASEASGIRLWLPALISGRNPDVGVVLKGARKNFRGRRPPSIVFEIVSPGAEARERDYVTKREEYLRFGLLEYWILDLELRRVTVLLRDGDAWAERVFDDGQVARGLALTGFAVPVADLWFIPEGEDDDAQGPAPGA